MPHPPFIRVPRYSLRTTLLVTTAIVAWLGYNAHIVIQRRALLAERGWHSFNPNAEQLPGIPLIRRWMGDAPVASLTLNRNGDVQDQLRRAKRLFPEAKVVQIETFRTPEWPADLPRSQ